MRIHAATATVPSYNEDLRQEIMAILKTNSIDYTPRGEGSCRRPPWATAGSRSTMATVAGGARGVPPGTYVQTVGPRFETKAEVRFLKQLGDIVGMTGASADPP